MTAPHPMPELGLERGKLFSLADPARRKRLSPAAIEAFFKIAEHWDLKGDTCMALLGGVSHGRYYELKKNRRGVLGQDELTRISLLMDIFKTLNLLFGTKLANQWVSRPTTIPCLTMPRRFP